MLNRGMYLSLIAAAFMDKDALELLDPGSRDQFNPKLVRTLPEPKPGTRSQDRKNKRKAARKKAINNRKRRGYK